MVEKVKVGVRGQVVIPKRIRRKLNIEHGAILQIEESDGSLLLRPVDPIREMKGLGKGFFGDPLRYQRKIRKEWEAESVESNT